MTFFQNTTHKLIIVVRNCPNEKKNVVQSLLHVENAGNIYIEMWGQLSMNWSFTHTTNNSYLW